MCVCSLPLDLCFTITTEIFKACLCVLMRASTCVYVCANIRSVSCVLVSKLVRSAHSISSQAKVKAPWHGVPSDGELIDNCITVLLCLTIGLLWPSNWNGLKAVNNVSRIVYAVILIFSV